jgi:hypothetical protein
MRLPAYCCKSLHPLETLISVIAVSTYSPRGTHSQVHVSVAKTGQMRRYRPLQLPLRWLHACQQISRQLVGLGRASVQHHATPARSTTAVFHTRQQTKHTKQACLLGSTCGSGSTSQRAAVSPPPAAAAEAAATMEWCVPMQAQDSLAVHDITCWHTFETWTPNTRPLMLHARPGDQIRQDEKGTTHCGNSTGAQQRAQMVTCWWSEQRLQSCTAGCRLTTDIHCPPASSNVKSTNT